MLGCWGWREGGMCCGSLEKEMELVVLQLWLRRSCVKMWWN